MNYGYVITNKCNSKAHKTNDIEFYGLDLIFRE